MTNNREDANFAGTQEILEKETDPNETVISKMDILNNDLFELKR